MVADMSVKPLPTMRETLAEALWQAESVRASGRRRLTAWGEEGEDTREKWRFMADAALAVVRPALRRDAPEMMRREERLRELLAADRTLAEAAAEMGEPYDRIKEWARARGLKSSPVAIRRAQASAARKLTPEQRARGQASRKAKRLNKEALVHG
jgi:hypothetical protein